MMNDLPEGQTQHDQTPDSAASELSAGLERWLLRRVDMTEQELREDFFARTGRVATKDIGAYAAFCEGVKCGFREGYEKGASAFHDAVKTEREACAKVCEGTMDEAVLGGNDDYNTGREMGATVCANRIRMRSNVEVTGAARPLCAASVLTAGLCPGDDKGE